MGGLLATHRATTVPPFVGLFGTRWGLMTQLYFIGTFRKKIAGRNQFSAVVVGTSIRRKALLRYTAFGLAAGGDFRPSSSTIIFRRVTQSYLELVGPVVGPPPGGLACRAISIERHHCQVFGAPTCVFSSAGWRRR